MTIKMMVELSREKNLGTFFSARQSIQRHLERFFVKREMSILWQDITIFKGQIDLRSVKSLL